MPFKTTETLRLRLRAHRKIAGTTGTLDYKTINYKTIRRHATKTIITLTVLTIKK